MEKLIFIRWDWSKGIFGLGQNLYSTDTENNLANF